MLQNQQWCCCYYTGRHGRCHLVSTLNIRRGSIPGLVGLEALSLEVWSNFIDKNESRFCEWICFTTLSTLRFSIFADSYLTVGVIILLIAMLKKRVNGNKMKTGGHLSQTKLCPDLTQVSQSRE